LLAQLDSSLPGGWTTATIRELLNASSAGVAPLLDLLVALEYWGFGADYGWKRQTIIARDAMAIRDALQNTGVLGDDPRLGDFIHEVVRAVSPSLRRAPIGEIVGWIADHAHRPDITDDVASALWALVAEISSIRAQSVSQQIKGVVQAVVPDSRDARILIRRHGWGGQAPATLQEVANDEGLTRERIRQICVRAHRALASAAGVPFAPALDDSLMRLSLRTPLSASDALRLLAEAGFTDSDEITVAALLGAATLLGRTTAIQLRRSGPVQWVCVEGDDLPNENNLDAVRTRAGRLTDARGATTVASLCLTLAEKDGLDLDEETVVSLLPLVAGFEWLDKQNGWFWITGRSPGRNRLLNLLRKALCVSGCLPIEDVRAAVRRSRRLKGPLPPADVLVTMCKAYPGLRTDGEMLCADPPLEYRQVLQGTELYLVELLLQMGSVARVEEMWQLAGNEGIGRVSFFMRLCDSPTIVKYARGTYGLRGMPVPAGDVWEVANKRIQRANSVLRDWGHLSTDVVWMLFKFSSATIRTHQLPVPAALAGEIDGDYSLSLSRQVLRGTATIEGACARGLRTLLKSGEVEAGDWALMAVDLSTRAIHVRVGDQELSLSDEADVAELVTEGRDSFAAARRPSQILIPATSEEAEEDAISSNALRAERPLTSEIISILARAGRPLKAKEIAHALTLVRGKQVKRGQVNALLYGELSMQVVNVGNSGSWTLWSSVR
jgi:hypothetical protein